MIAAFWLPAEMQGFWESLGGENICKAAVGRHLAGKDRCFGKWNYSDRSSRLLFGHYQDRLFGKCGDWNLIRSSQGRYGMRLHRARLVIRNTSKKRKEKKRKEKKRKEKKSNHDIESQPTAEFQITPSTRNPRMTKKLSKLIIHDKHLCWK